MYSAETNLLLNFYLGRDEETLSLGNAGKAIVLDRCLHSSTKLEKSDFISSRIIPINFREAGFPTMNPERWEAYHPDHPETHKIT